MQADDKRKDEVTVEQRPPEGAALACGFDSSKPVYGGQAVMEGVMMRGRKFAATVVRREDGELVLRTEEAGGFLQRHRWLNKPFVRGPVTLGSAMLLGFRSLLFSGDVLSEEMGDQEKVELDEAEVDFETLAEGSVRARHQASGLEVTSTRGKTKKDNRERAFRILRGKIARNAPPTEDAPEPDAAEADGPGPPEKKQEGGFPVWAYVMMGLTMIGAVVFIVSVPHLGRKYIVGLLPGLEAYVYEFNGLKVNLGANLVEGLIRLLFMVLYVGVIGYMPDIKRVFQYHGAEHKTVHAVEAGVELTPDNLRQFSTIHPRCGTNFLFIVIAVKIVLFSFLEWESPVLRIVTRLAILPIVAGIAYEILRLAGRYKNSFLMRAVIAPGLWMQNLTTRPPTDDQVEVAISAMQETIALEMKAGDQHA